MRPYILGVDIGTGSTKCIATALDGRVLANSQHHYPILQPHPGHSEQDPELIWQAFVKCLQEVTKQLDQAPLAVSFSAAMHSLILANEAGEPLKNMITWANTRSEGIAEDIRRSDVGEHIYRQSGTPIHPMSPLCKLIWLRMYESGSFSKASKYISIKEYIWFKIFQVFEVDHSIASATGLFDIMQLRWSDEACRLAGVPLNKLSDPVDTDHKRKGVSDEMAKLLGVAPDTWFVIGASDGCCANLGSHAGIPSTAALTIGTSGAVRVTSASPIYNYQAMVFNYRLDRQTFVSGGAVNNGGIAVNWLLKNFLEIYDIGPDDYDKLFKAIDTIPPGSEGLTFLPYLYGERAPIWDARSTGSFLNIKPAHGQKHFLRAGLEGICYALNDVLVTLEDDASVKISQISISGGFINSSTWTQMLANITGKKLVAMQIEDASAMGAVYIAIKALFPDLKLPSPSPVMEVHPDGHAYKRYSEIFPLYRRLYQDLKDSIRSLNQLH
jgi:gluconokinase